MMQLQLLFREQQIKNMSKKIVTSDLDDISEIIQKLKRFMKNSLNKMFTKNGKIFMRYENLGNSDLNVSKICLGTMTFGEQVSESLSLDLLNFANEKDINFVDTAEMYPVYPKETHGIQRIIGKWIKEKNRIRYYCI